MLRRLRQLQLLTGGVLTPLLAVVVALRVIAAPLVMAAPEPGLIALCSGGQIYYVTLDGTPADADTPQPDRCPFLGITLALADPGPAIPLPRRGRAEQRLPVPPVKHVPDHPVPANPARAPPLAV